MSTPVRWYFIVAAALLITAVGAEIAAASTGHTVPHAVRFWLLIPCAAATVTGTLLYAISQGFKAIRAELKAHDDQQSRKLSAWCEYVATHDQVMRSRNSAN